MHTEEVLKFINYVFCTCLSMKIMAFCIHKCSWVFVCSHRTAQFLFFLRFWRSHKSMKSMLSRVFFSGSFWRPCYVSLFFTVKTERRKCGKSITQQPPLDSLIKRSASLLFNYSRMSQNTFFSLLVPRLHFHFFFP